MEVYVDDMITKSKVPAEHMMHLKKTFELLRKYKMKLNPEKFVFEVSSRESLGFFVRHRGIEANPEKIRVVIEMKSPHTLKNIQSLIGKLIALNRFISQAIDKSHVFFKVMRKWRKIEWKTECNEVFQQLKQYMLKALLLSMPREGDKLYFYLAISQWATSTVIVKEEAGI